MINEPNNDRLISKSQSSSYKVIVPYLLTRCVICVIENNLSAQLLTSTLVIIAQPRRKK